MSSSLRKLGQLQLHKVDKIVEISSHEWLYYLEKMSLALMGMTFDDSGRLSIFITGWRPLSL